MVLPGWRVVSIGVVYDEKIPLYPQYDLVALIPLGVSS